MLFEVGKKGMVREVLQAGGVISHGIGLAWDELGDMAVAVLALVVTREDALVSGRARRGGGPFGNARDGRGVVTHREDSGVARIVEVSDDAELGEDPRMFQVAVRDGSRGVVDAHQALLDFSGEGHAPQVGLAARVKVDSAHSRFCCVGGSKEGRLLRDNFCQVSGSLA